MSKLSNKPWGDVDKAELMKYVIAHPEKAKDVYMKIDKNWQDNPHERLSYPIADKSGTVYRYALSTALTYAKANNETRVINKLKKLYKEYGIEEGFNMRKIVEAYIPEGKVSSKYNSELNKLKSAKLTEGEDIEITSKDGLLEIYVFWSEPSVNLNWYPIIQVDYGDDTIFNEEGPENDRAWKSFLSNSVIKISKKIDSVKV